MNNLQKCPYCHTTLSLRVITLYTGMVGALWEVYKYAKDNNKTRFTRKEIKPLLIGNENTTARFGDWVLFGGLIYKEGRGNYVINLERCEKYFQDELEIPNRVVKDPITGEIVERKDYRSARGTRSIREMLDSDNRYILEYKDRSQNYQPGTLL